jgi:hypothetical protein
VRRASIRNAASIDSLQDLVELGLAYAKTIVLYRKRFFGLIEVKRQTIVDVNRAKRADSGFRKRDAQYSGEHFGGGLSVVRRNDQMVKLYVHRAG